MKEIKLTAKGQKIYDNYKAKVEAMKAEAEAKQNETVEETETNETNEENVNADEIVDQEE